MFRCFPYSAGKRQSDAPDKLSLLPMKLPTGNFHVLKTVYLLVLSFATLAKGQISCNLLPCKNGGSCYPGEIGYVCHCTEEFTGQNCTELSFKASIGIYGVESYLPGIQGESADMTNFNAKRLGSSVFLDVTTPQLSSPNTFKWTLNGTSLDSAIKSDIYISPNGRLSIYGGSLADEGVYQVFVTNEFGTLFSRKIELKFAVTGNFLSPDTPINISMAENEPFLLRCPPREYSYQVDFDWDAPAIRDSIANNPLYAPRILMEPNGDLLFSYVERSDFTTFISQGQSYNPIRCRTSNRYSQSATGPPVYFYIPSSATPSPQPSVATPSPQPSFLRFYTQPQGLYTLLTGDQFYLNCTAGGRPVPRIQWYKGGVLINDSGDLFQHQLHNRTLRLGSLSSRTHDGKYKCEAVSDIWNVTASFEIKVIENVTAVYANQDDPYDLRAGKHGESVAMFCNTTGDPIISWTWYYNGEELQHSSKFANRWSVNQSSGTLEIRNLKLSDFGFYQCLAKNELSEDNRRSFLVVTGAPLPPINVKTTDCANFTTNITWGMRLPPDLLPPTGFIIEWRSKVTNSRDPFPAFSKLVELPGGSVRSHVVRALKPYNEMQFRIRAKNAIGVGFPGVSSSFCNTNSTKPSLDPKNLTGSPNGEGRLSVRWAALDPEDWSGDSCSYRILYRQIAPNSTWNNQTRVFGCSRNSHNLYSLIPNTETKIAIRAENIIGPGPSSPIVRTRSGQGTPQRITNVTIVHVDASSIELKWSAIPVSPPKTVDGYWIFVFTSPYVKRNREEEVEIPQSRKQFADTCRDLPPNVEEIFPNDTICIQVNKGLREVVTGLKPWTTYYIYVLGYNNAGISQELPHLVTDTTLDSKDSYYILSLRITSENFTEDLKDETSTRFISLKGNLTREVLSLYKNHRWFKKASLISFSPGSVQAEFQLEVASPNMSVVRQVVAVMNNLGNFSLDSNVTNMRSEKGIQSVTANVSSLLVNVSSKVVISCTVIGGPDELNISWFKEDKVLGLTQRTKVETSLNHSVLTIRDVMAEDEGNYSCNASKGLQNRGFGVTIKVVPVLQIQPRAISKRVGDQATFNCTVVSGYRQGARVSIVEVTNKDNEVRHQGSSFTAVNLQIPEGGKSHTRRFVCEMWEQQQLLSRSRMAELFIIPPGAPKCPAELLEGVSWTATAAGATDVQPCPKGAKGTASRECSEKASWKKASFVACRSAEFVRLGNEIEAITEGFQSDVRAQEVLSQLVNASQPITNNSKRPTEIYGGDLVIAVNILVRLADYNSDQGNVSSAEDVNNYAQVASNLLDSANSRTWQKLENEGQGRSQILVKAVDDYGLGVAATLNGSQKSRSVRTNNLVIRIDRIDQDSPLRGKGLSVSYNQSSIFLPPEAFHSRDSRVVTLVYLTLNDVLPLAKDKDEDKPILPNTTIVSSTVVPRPLDNFNQPVKTVLQNRRVEVPHGVTPKARCVFWRPGGSATWQTSGCRLVPSESDVAMTTCECDHLTIFASLMDPYDSSIGEADKKALEIISIVGCTISLLAVLITIVVTLFFWRVVKSPRAKVLLNLCAAIALSCIFVISEGSARDSKAGCTVIAAFLHYFLLALFSWMLCEGVLLYFLLVKVFGGRAQEKVKYFYIFGWGFPAIIVAISLAATQADGYGTTEACWLDVSSGLIWAFIAPALIIILINTVVFILVIRQMMGTRHVQNKTQIEKVKAGVKASAVILPLLGITWLFGLLSFSSATVAFKYIFAIFNSLQGLMIFIFHCLLNKQIKDAIKRRRDKSSSGVVSSTPKSKPSPILPAKHAVKPQGKVSAPKKRSNRAQNDYEMMVNTNTVSTLPSNSLANKNAIIDIPDEQLPEAIRHLRDAPAEPNDLPAKSDQISPLEDGPSSVSEENSSEEITSRNSLILHTEAIETNGEESTEGPGRGEESAVGDRGWIDGAANHIYLQTPQKYDPSFKELDKKSEAALLSTKESASSSTPDPGSLEGLRRDEELAAIDRGSMEGMNKHIFLPTPKENDSPLEEKTKERDAARRIPKVSSSSSSSDSEEESVEVTAEINHEVDPGDISCVIEQAPLEGALPSTNSQEAPALTSTKRMEPRQVDDDVKDDGDFEVKMRKRRVKVDTIQTAADAFTSVQNKTSPTETTWEKIRQRIHRSSYKVTHPGETREKTSISSAADVEDLEIV